MWQWAIHSPGLETSSKMSTVSPARSSTVSFHARLASGLSSRDSKPEANLVWKDTVLLRAGETVDILLDVSNPGLWMAHCHIAEHNQSGMMFSFNVARAPEPTR